VRNPNILYKLQLPTPPVVERKKLQPCLRLRLQ